MNSTEKKRVISFTGAGGKTTSIFQLAGYYRKKNKRVLITTTTHMKQEEGLLCDLESIKDALEKDGYAFAAVPLPPVKAENGTLRSKAGALPEKILTQAIELADVTLIEADGARLMPFKVPRAWEPVIHPETTDIVIVAGGDALGKRICDVSMNPDDVAAVLKESGDDCGKDVDVSSILTRERMELCVRRTYLPYFRDNYPDASVRLFVNPKIPGKGILDFPVEVLYDNYTLNRKEKTNIFHLLLLAAGYSKRYGGNKLLDVRDGKQLYRHIYDRLAKICALDELNCDLTVVTQYEEIRQQAVRDRVRCVINPEPSRGISSSLQCGVAQLLSEGKMGPDEYLVSFVADQPRLQTDTILRFLREYASSGKELGCISKNGVMGNPCAFASKYMNEIMTLTGDRGGKRILLANTQDLFSMEVPDEAELEDIDYRN